MGAVSYLQAVTANTLSKTGVGCSYELVVSLQQDIVVCTCAADGILGPVGCSRDSQHASPLHDIYLLLPDIYPLLHDIYLLLHDIYPFLHDIYLCCIKAGSITVE